MQRLVPNYVVGFRPGWVYSPVSRCHQYSRVSVIVFAGYLLLLFFVSLKPFSLILSIDVLSMLSKQMIKRYGASMSPCKTPATMSKYSVSPSDERTFTLMFL